MEKKTKKFLQNIREPQWRCCIFANENNTENVGTANKQTPALSYRFNGVQAALEAPLDGTAATPRRGVKLGRQPAVAPSITNFIINHLNQTNYNYGTGKQRTASHQPAKEHGPKERLLR